jgi:hypothetical protein
MLYEAFLRKHRKVLITFGILATLKLFFIFGAILYLTHLAYVESDDVTIDIFWFRTIATFVFFFITVFAEIATFGILWSMFKRDPIAQYVITHKGLNNLDHAMTRLI